MKGGTLGPGEGVLGLAEAAAFSNLPQRLAYGLTPENEHHLVAQRDVRQFQVGAAGPLVGGRGLPCAGCPGQDPTPHARVPEQQQRAMAPGGLAFGRGGAVPCPCRRPLASASGSWPAPATALLSSACTELSPGRVTKLAEGILC